MKSGAELIAVVSHDYSFISPGRACALGCKSSNRTSFKTFDSPVSWTVLSGVAKIAMYIGIRRTHACTTVRSTNTTTKVGLLIMRVNSERHRCKCSALSDVLWHVHNELTEFGTGNAVDCDWHEENDEKDGP